MQANNMELSTDTRVPPPSWINHDFIESSLKKAEGKEITVDSVNIQYANPEGVGYSSLMFRLTAFVRYGDNEEAQIKTLIVKTALESGELKEVAAKVDVFKIEGEMLHDVMPQVHEQLAALEGDEFRPLTAKCYEWGRQPAAFVLLEDLKAAGFGLAEAGQPLDFIHCAVGLRAYARLHAASAYILSKQPHYKDQFSYHMFTNADALEFMGTLGKKLMTGLANEFDKCPGYEQYAKRYKTYANHFINDVRERMEQVKKQTKLPVFTHSDCWKNNMMFKYIDGEIAEFRLVDFQFASVTSPASDILCFLYANASEEVHRHHMEELLTEYHSTLVALLRRLGMEQEAESYTLEEFRNEMDHCLPIAVFYSTLNGFVLSSEEHALEYVKAFSDSKKLDEVIVKSFKNPYSLPYMKFVTPIFVRKGIL